jgi:TRAP-type C4-dicarboxylate transport system permease small subunit
MPFPSRFGRIVSAALLVISAIPLIIMMVVVTGNSLGRALFKTPISGTIEIAGLAGVILVAAAVGFTARERGNVAVDVLMSRLSPRVKGLFDVFTFFLSLAAVSFLLWAVVLEAFSAQKMKETTLTMGISTAPFKSAWAAGILILACFLLVHLVVAIRKKGKT